MSEDWLEELFRDYQDAITRGAYTGIYALDEAALDLVMREQASSCVHSFVRLFDIPAGLDLDGFLEAMATGGSAKVNVKRDGDTILWEEEHNGECLCPLVKRGVVPLKPQLCVCGVHWLRMLVERHTDRRVHVEMLDSVATGSRNCTMRITLGAPPDAA